MKKIGFGIVAAAMVAVALAFGACSDSDSSDGNGNDSSRTDSVQADNGGRTLVVYYSQKLPDGVDGTTGATNVVQAGGTDYGANQYLALMIAGKTGADTLRLTVPSGYYPQTYSELAAFARDERDNATHPRLTSRTVNIADYDNVFLSMPVWWGTMPMPVMSFLDQYDLSGKRVFVVATHAGSSTAVSGIIDAVKTAEPQATVSADGFTISAARVSASTSDAVDEWLARIGF